MTRAEFYFKIAPLVARIGDGHTSIGPPDEEYVYYRHQQKGVAFPFNIDYDTLSGMTITRNYSGDSTPAIGDRIVSINSRSADSLFLFYLKGFSGERMVFRVRRCIERFRSLLWLDGINSPYNIVIRKYDTQKQIAEYVKGVALQDVLKTDSLLTSRSMMLPDFSFKRLQDNIGYIDFRSMEDLTGFKKFLSATFEDIHANPVRGLVIDLRKNTGGNSQLGEELLPFLTDSSYRMFARFGHKMSAQLKTYKRQAIPWWIRWFPLTWVSSEAKGLFSVEDGEIVVDTMTAEPPENNSLRYKGRTCFLIGSVTFSSATNLANTVGDYKLATLIGEETGGIPNTFGDYYPFDLPDTKLEVCVSSAFYVRANGNTADRRGVIPDIEVRGNEKDMRSGKDTVLERAKQWILEGK